MSTQFEDRLRARSGWRPALVVPDMAEPPEPGDTCAYAEEFATMTRALLDQLTQHAPRHRGESDTTLLWAKATLLDQFADFLADTPPGHTNPAGEAVHRCIADVFVETVTAIRRFQRALPPAPPPPPVVIPPALLPQQVSGLFYQE
jgi:hypothetical protein